MVRKLLVTALIAPMMIACTPFASSAPVLSPEQSSLVQVTCDRVMGLARGGVYREYLQMVRTNAGWKIANALWAHER